MNSSEANPGEPWSTLLRLPATPKENWREKLLSRRVARTIPRLTDRSCLPLSFAQERVWLLEQLEPGSPVSNRPVALRLSGDLSPGAVRKALQGIVDRHEVLRARYTTCDGLPCQVIRPSADVTLRLIDLSRLASDERVPRTDVPRAARPCSRMAGTAMARAAMGQTAELEALAMRLAAEEGLEPFDLARAPLMRATLLRLGKQDYVLLLTFHHIVFDAWSAQIAVSEFAELYRSLNMGTSAALPELPIQFGDYAHWQRQRLSSEMLDRQLGYWREQLRGLTPLDLPADCPRPRVQSSRGECTVITLPAAVADSLKALGRQENATLFMVLLAAFQAVLARYTGQDDFAVGSPVAGRHGVETENLIGIFLNLLVLRANLAGKPTFRELLARVRETCRGAYSHQDLPFEKLVEALRPERDRSTTPLFQVMFNLENFPVQRRTIPGLRVEEFEFEWPVAPYDLTLEIVPARGELKCYFNYNADLFDRCTIERFAAHYRKMLDGVIREPDHGVESIPILTSEERSQIMAEWNRTEADYPRDATLHSLFEAQAARSPRATAFFNESSTMSYGELNSRSNQLGRYLRNQGVGPDSFVGVCLERSAVAVVALLGVLKAGAAFVPLDPGYPRDRLAFLISDARIGLVISRRKWLPLVREKGVRVVCLDTEQGMIEAQRDYWVANATGPTDNAYLLYTSGSSGVPKGVLGPHRGAVNRFAWMWKGFPFERGEVCCLKTSLNFVDSIWEVFGPLLRGVPSLILSDQTVRDPAELVRALESHAVTRVVTVPSLLSAILESYPDLGNRLPHLKLWVSSGEALSADLCRRFYAAMPGATLLNLYGSTEVAADVTFHVARPAPDDRGSIPLGRPIDNTKCYVLDAQLRLVPIGVRGELYVGGDGLAKGYYNRPDLTKASFIADPFSSRPDAQLYETGDLARYLPDGNLQFLGRVDQQVKIRGYRIELGEIETILTQHPLVSAASVVVRKDASGEKCLMAYVVPRKADNKLSLNELLHFIKAKLPDYMIPSDIVTIDALPQTPNGKTDRRALATHDAPRPGSARHVPPSDAQQFQLVKIWEEVLGVRPIGIEHNFFDLGGHSLLAMRLMDRIEKAYGQRLPLATLFEEATIKHQAERLRAESLKDGQAAIVPMQPNGSRPPLFFLNGDWWGGLYCRKLARMLGDEQPFYSVMPNGFDGSPLLPSVEAMAEENIDQVLAIHAQGPYLLGGYCNGGLVAYEMAQQMARRGLEVGLVILLDAGVPRNFAWLKAVVDGACRLARLNEDQQARIYAKSRTHVLRMHNAYHHSVRTLMAISWRAARERLLLLDRESPDKLGLLPEFADPAQLLRYRQFRRIISFYRPKPYPGRVVLLRTHRSNHPSDPTAGWGKLAPQLEVHELPGDHVSILAEHLEVVGEQVKSSLHSVGSEAQHAVAYCGRLP